MRQGKHEERDADATELSQILPDARALDARALEPGSLDKLLRQALVPTSKPGAGRAALSRTLPDRMLATELSRNATPQPGSKEGACGCYGPTPSVSSLGSFLASRDISRQTSNSV